MITSIPPLPQLSGDSNKDIKLLYDYIVVLTRTLTEAPTFASDSSVQQDNIEIGSPGLSFLEAVEPLEPMIIPGPQGPQGQQGMPGSPGLDAEEAEVPISIPGLQGATGPAGPAGPMGFDGEEGWSEAPLLIAGPQGAVGPVGQQGSPGIDGESIEQDTSLPAQNPVGQSNPFAVSFLWPVGAVFISVVSTNPATLLGFGTWSTFGAGRVLVSLDSGDVDFDVVEETGGAKTVALTVSEMPVHTHTQDSHNHTQDSHTHALTDNFSSAVRFCDAGAPGGGSYGDIARANTPSAIFTAVVGGTVAVNQATVAVNQNTGGGTAHSNLQPYIVVYMWKRIA